jgi:hypothetical protein
VFILLGAVVGFAIWFTKKQSVPNSHDKKVHNCFVLPIYRKHPSAHVLLLSKFLKSAQPIEYYQIGPIGIKDWAVSSWTNVLGEEPASTIRCFINQGLLEPTDLAGRLGWQYVVVELKDFLRERGLRVSGRKADLVERLVMADLEGMEKIAGTTVAYRCSEKGREIAEQYLLEKKDKEEKAREDTFNALEQREFEQAWEIMTSHNAQRVFSDGLMTDIQEFMGSCRAIFAYQPKMLASLNSKQIEQLRCLAAMSSFGWEEYPSNSAASLGRARSHTSATSRAALHAPASPLGSAMMANCSGRAATGVAAGGVRMRCGGRRLVWEAEGRPSSFCGKRMGRGWYRQSDPTPQTEGCSLCTTTYLSSAATGCTRWHTRPLLHDGALHA